MHDIEFSQSIDQIVQHTLPALKKLKEQGLARYIGITSKSNLILDEKNIYIASMERGWVHYTLHPDRPTHQLGDGCDRSDNVSGKVSAVALSCSMLIGWNMVDVRAVDTRFQDSF